MLIIINLIALAIIVFIVYWFWWAKPAAVTANTNQVTIYVRDGTYVPAEINIPANQPIELIFIREDAAPCSEQVVFAGLDISVKLPHSQAYSLKLPELSPGNYRFTCQMGMYQGELIVQ